VNKGSGTATMSGSITNNTIGTTGVNKSGSIEASGIIIGTRGASGTHTTLIEDNDIFGWNDRAIVLENGEGSPTLNATVRGNTANTFDSINGLHGLHADLGILAADAGSVCLDAGGIVAADRNQLTLAGNEPAGGADLRVRRGSAVNLRMPGYAGGADDDAAVTSYLTGRNDVTSTSITVRGPAPTPAGAPVLSPEPRPSNAHLRSIERAHTPHARMLRCRGGPLVSRQFALRATNAPARPTRGTTKVSGERFRSGRWARPRRATPRCRG
jgi:hypothetical protein